MIQAACGTYFGMKCSYQNSNIMKLRIISPNVHGIIDYSAAAALTLSPILLGLGDSSSVAFWASIIAGIAVVFVSLNTTYKFSLLNNIPFDGHLAIDLTVAIAFMLLPFIFSFSGIDAYYYWANATVVFLVVALSDSPKLVNSAPSM